MQGLELEPKRYYYWMEMPKRNHAKSLRMASMTSLVTEMMNAVIVEYLVDRQVIKTSPVVVVASVVASSVVVEALQPLFYHNTIET